ncbi:MAG: Lrp/AsnC family transcriptional regulator [Candidatus Bathyarchaeia archaeon]
MQPNIDEIDSIILKRLLLDSRTSFTNLAKECKISVVATRMRYKRLYKEGVITGETMLVNPFSLGYKYISLIGIVTSKENEEKAIKFLQLKLPRTLIGRRFGVYNLWIPEVAFHNIEEISKLQRELEASPYIKTADAVLLSENSMIPQHPENLVIKPFGGKLDYTPRQIKQSEIELDETDRKIAKALVFQARIPFRKIANQLGISTKNVIERYKRLKGTLFTLSTIMVDLNKLGYHAGAFMVIKLANKSRMLEVEAELLKTPNVILLVKYIGAYDMFAHVVFESFESYFGMMHSIYQIPDIDRVDLFLVPSFRSWPANVFASLL